MLPVNQNKSDDPAEHKVVSTQVTEYFSGPLPHPKIIEQYNNIVSGSADRIIRKFESQTEHRQKIENRFVWAETIRSIGGLVGGFVIISQVHVEYPQTVNFQKHALLSKKSLAFLFHFYRILWQ